MSALKATGPKRSQPSEFRRPWLGVWGAIFVCCWGGNQFSPLLLMYEERAHYSSVVVNALLATYVFGLIPALLVTGSMSDRHGRKVWMLVGVASTLLGSALLACGTFGVILLAAGRLFSGVGVGVAMAVGVSWLIELSSAPSDPHATSGSGARRSSVVFGFGSATGALVAGSFAQWGPSPEVLPFVIHILATLPFLWIVTRVPETDQAGGVRTSLWRQLRIPGVGHKRFIRVVVIAAPWLFASASIGYGYLPTQVDAGSFGLIFATTASIITLGTSSLVQPFARSIHSRNSARGLIVAVSVIGAGLGVVTLSLALQSIAMALIASLVLGVGIGIGQTSGLLEVQRIAGPGELAALNGAFYALAYSGFLVPVAIAALAIHVSAVTVLCTIVTLAAVTCLLLMMSSRRYLAVSQ
ncbi:UNVERIFIED_CONTAM: MFS transporter [Williamsia faeni]